MTDKEVAVFVEWPELADYYESIVARSRNDEKFARLVTNYVLTDYLKLLKDSGAGQIIDSALNTVAPTAFAELIAMIASGDVNSRAAKDILGLMFKEKGSAPRALADKHGLIQKSDASDLVPAIEKVIADNQKVVDEYKSGKIASLQYLIGQAMRATKGAGNPEVVKKLLVEKLER